MAPLFVCFPLKTVFLFCSVVKYQICKGCSMLLPNKCSFRAHLRIHAHKSPYCCPECGSLCRSADIQKHVRENCLHYARKAWYKWVTWQEMQVFFKKNPQCTVHCCNNYVFLFFQMSSLWYGFPDPSRTKDSYRRKTLWGLVQVLHLPGCIQDLRQLWTAFEK